MTLKTNLRNFLLIWTCVLSATICTTAIADDITCLRELLPITDKVSFQGDRQGLEKPFVVNEKFIVFPEVKDGKVSGFYVYGKKRGQYYDVVQLPSRKTLKRMNLGTLLPGPIYDMVAQPEGLETVTIAFAPDLKNINSRTPSSAALGASMLPVVGAFVALQERRDAAPAPVYVWPDALQSENKTRKLMQLGTLKTKTTEELQKPLRHELEIRKNWIQKANLDDATFKDLNRILQHSCNSL